MATRTIGRQAVFKPEVAGRFSATVSPLQAGLAPRQQMTRVNVAVQKTADALGFGDVMVKTTAGTHKGVFGMFMDMAPTVFGRDMIPGIGRKGWFQ